MVEELVPIQVNDYKGLLLQTIAVIEHALIKVARHISATANNPYWETGELLNKSKLYQLGKEIDSEKLKQFVSVIGAELVNPKLQQFVGELLFTVNKDIIKLHLIGGNIQHHVSKSYGKIEVALP